MALPVVKQPTYFTHIHSLNKEIPYRPYNVGEEKILMMVSESDDPKFVAENMKKVIQACVMDPDVDVGKLASYDVELLLIKIRAKSSGEIISIKYTDPDTDKKYEVDVNIEDISISFYDEHVYDITDGDNLHIELSDLTFDKMLAYQSNSSTTQDATIKAEMTYDIIIDCVKKIYDENEVWVVGEDITKAETTEFINNLTGVSKYFHKFISTMPAVIYELKLEDGKTVKIQDIKSFLA